MIVFLSAKYYMSIISTVDVHTRHQPTCRHERPCANSSGLFSAKAGRGTLWGDCSSFRQERDRGWLISMYLGWIRCPPQTFHVTAPGASVKAYGVSMFAPRHRLCNVQRPSTPHQTIDPPTAADYPAPGREQRTRELAMILL